MLVIFYAQFVITSFPLNVINLSSKYYAEYVDASQYSSKGI